MATKLKSGYSWKFVNGKMSQVKNGAAINPGLAGKSTGADIGGTTNKSKSAAANAARVGAGGAPKTGMNKTPGRTAANRRAALNKAKPSLRTKIAGAIGGAVGKVDTKAKRKAALNKAKTSIFASAKNAVNSAKGAGSRSSKQIAAAKENILKAVAASAAARKGRKISSSYKGGTSTKSKIRNAFITARSKGRGSYSRGFALPKRKLRKVSTIRSYAPGKAVNTSA